MKKLLLILCAILSTSSTSIGQRYYERYDGPLPSGNTTGQFFLYAIGLAVVGFTLFKASEWFKGDNKENNFSTGVGCLGMIAIGGALLCLIPLLAWVEVVGNAIIGIVFIGGFSLFIIALIWNWLSGRFK